MLRRLVVAIMLGIVIVACAPNVAPAQPYRWSEVTVDQAARIVRDFAGDPNLELTYKGIEDIGDIWLAPWMFGVTVDHVFESGHREYCVGVVDPNGINFFDESYIINRETYYGEPFDEAALHARQMPVEDARPLAEAALAAHHPEAGLLTMYRVDDYPTTGREDSIFAAYYRFHYQRVLDNGASAPSSAAIMIDSIFGTLLGYVQFAYPVLVDWHPILDEQDAIDAAAAALFIGDISDPEVKDLWVTPPDELGLERLIWTVALSGYSAFGEGNPWQRVRAAVDAHTGEVPDWSEIGSIPPPSARTHQPKFTSKPLHQPPAQLLRTGKPLAVAYPPVVINGGTYLYLLNLPGLGADMELLGPGHAKLKGANGTGYVDANRGVLTLNDQPFLRYGKPLIIKGRTYVPFDFARRLLGVSLTVRRAPPFP